MPFLSQLADDLEKKLGGHVTIRVSLFGHEDDYEDKLQKLLGGQYDFLRLGPASYVEVKQRKGGNQIDAMVMELEVADGDEAPAAAKEHTHPSFFFVHKDSGITKAEQLRGKKVAVVDPQSTSTVYCKSLLKRAKLRNVEDVTLVEYPHHTNVADAVANRYCDAGFVRHSHFNKRNVFHHGVLIPILTVDVPNKPWVGRVDNPIVFKAMQECMLEFKNASALDKLGIIGFDRVRPNDYDPLKEVVELSQAFDRGE